MNGKLNTLVLVAIATTLITLLSACIAPTPPVVDSVSICTIQQPEVTKKWSAYPGIRNVGCFLHPGDKVEFVKASGCVCAGGGFLTYNWGKRYVDPVDQNCKPDSLHYGMIAIPGTIGEEQNLSIKDFATKKSPIIISNLIANPVLELGYMDDDYGDNRYDHYQDADCDQCRSEGPAYIILRITHFKQ